MDNWREKGYARAQVFVAPGLLAALSSRMPFGLPHAIRVALTLYAAMTPEEVTERLRMEAPEPAWLAARMEAQARADADKAARRGPDPLAGADDRLIPEDER
jgi:hypothetical protein